MTNEADHAYEYNWMHCPYNADICGREATLTDLEFTDGSDGGLVGIVTCAAGHRWRVEKLPGKESDDG